MHPDGGGDTVDSLACLGDEVALGFGDGIAAAIRSWFGSDDEGTA